MIRHDIDSDPMYVLKWLEIQQKYGIHSSFYFRLCTVNLDVMRKVAESGSDCGYHYEELADYVKKHHILKKEEALQQLPAIQAQFKQNFRELEQRCGFKIKYIASHGDFANRKIGIQNHQLITREVMNECGIVFEAYQKEFTDTYSINISDRGYPVFYKGEISPEHAIEKGIERIHLLMHPKHWRSSLYWNSYENLKRAWEGVKYR